MSYRNPKIYAPDPTAFAKSFTSSFQSTFQNFEAEREKIRKQQEKDDLVEAELIKYQNIGDLEGVSESVNSALQQSINNLVDSKSFVEMSAVEKQKELNNIQNIKAGSAAFVDLMNIPTDELSNRSVQANPELHAILTQIKLDPSKVKITPASTGTDVMFTYIDESGNVNSTSLRDMRKFKNTYVTATDDVKFLNTNIDADIDGLQRKIDADARNNKATKDELVNQFFGKDEKGNYNNKLSNDEIATIFYEQIRNDDPIRKEIGFELYPKGASEDLIRMQEDAVHDYYKQSVVNQLRQTALTPPAASRITDTRTTDQKNADDLKTQADQVRQFMQNIVLTTDNPKMPKRPIKNILSDFQQALNPKEYRIVLKDDGGYNLEQLESTATGIKVNKDLTDITADIEALQRGDSSKLISTILTKVYKQLPILNN
tara:strand:+ start:2817 stop:4106 length:1290 start_codon:yes stop_codon:yes gene_type:complete